jgi:hypothetical protein
MEIRSPLWQRSFDLLQERQQTTCDLPNLAEQVASATEDVLCFIEQPTEATTPTRATGATIPAIRPTTEAGGAKLGIIKTVGAKLGATKPIEARCLVLIALFEVLIPFGSILTRFGAILTRFGEVLTPLGLVLQPAPDVSLREILAGLLELLLRLREVLSRLAGLLPRLAEVVARLAERGGGSVIVHSVHADLLL